jgi:hypothetical protein
LKEIKKTLRQIKIKEFKITNDLNKISTITLKNNYTAENFSHYQKKKGCRTQILE